MTRDAVRGTVALVVRTIGLQAMGFVAFIALARLISPADFGLFAIALGVQDLAMVVVSSGLPASLIRQPEHPALEDQQAVAGYSLLVAVLLSALALVVGFVALPALGLDSKAAELIAIACLALPILAWRIIPLALLSRGLRFERLAVIDVIARVALYGWALGWALAGFGVYALVSAIPVSAAVSSVLAARSQPWERGFSLDREIVARHARFGLQVAGIRMLVNAFPISAVSTFAAFGSPRIAGFYGLSRRSLGIAFSAVQALRRVGFPALSRLDPSARSRRTARVIAASSVAVSGALAVLAGAAEPLVVTLFGGRWLPAAEIMILSAPGLLLFASVGSAIGSRALADGDTRSPMLAVLGQILTTVGLAALLVGDLDTVGVGIAMGAGYAVYSTVLFALAGDAATRGATWVVGRALVAGAVATVAGQALNPGNDELGLLAAASLSAAVWAALALILLRSDLFALVRLLRRHMRRPAAEEPDLDPATAEMQGDSPVPRWAFRAYYPRRSQRMRPSFEQAYEDNAERVYGFFAYRLGSRMDAEDLTQLTFERALAAWGRYDARRAGVGTWLLAIARNALIDHRRRDRTRGRVSLSEDEVEEGQLPAVPAPDEVGIGLSPELASALGRLRNRDREVLALRFGADLRTHEIAEILDLSVANVQQILSRTLRKLRVELEAESAARR